MELVGHFDVPEEGVWQQEGGKSVADDLLDDLRVFGSPKYLGRYRVRFSTSALRSRGRHRGSPHAGS